MFDILPLVLMLLSLGVIFFVSIRKFPMLANLDIETIQSEREARFKEQIIGKRLKRSITEHHELLRNIWIPLSKAARDLYHWVLKKLIDIKEEHGKEPNILADHNTLESDLFSAKKLVSDGEFDEAEKKYINIISKDAKNIPAFKDLGTLYMERKKYMEALETLKHAAKLNQKATKENPADGNLKNQLAELYFSLASCARELKDNEQASSFLNLALEIYPSNPRYLDTKLEISIITRDKKNAEATLALLKNINPENQKIQVFQERINELDDM